MKKIKIYIPLILIFSTSISVLPNYAIADASANTSLNASNKCRIIHWKQGQRYTINGSLNMATHIVFPVSKLTDTVVGNTELWNVESAGNHVFFKPNSKSPEGQVTTLTYIGQNNRSYEFLLKRSLNPKETCVIVKDDGALLNNSWKNYQTPNEKTAELLKIQLEAQKELSEKEKEQIVKQQRKALNLYRKHIYTDYTWKNSKKNKKIINSVYDDERWTYIRLNTDTKGVMAIYGNVAKHKTVLEYQYDSTNKIYQVSGIFKELVLVYNKHKIHIIRNS